MDVVPDGKFVDKVIALLVTDKLFATPAFQVIPSIELSIWIVHDKVFVNVKLNVAFGLANTKFGLVPDLPVVDAVIVETVGVTTGAATVAVLENAAVPAPPALEAVTRQRIGLT